MEKKKIVVVTAIIENDNGDILLSQRYDPSFPDAHLKWDLPWWKNEFGENLEETILREVKEETWLDIAIQQMLPTHVFNLRETNKIHQHTLIFCFQAKKIWWEIYYNDPKIHTLKWVKKENIIEYDLLPGIQKLISFL